MIVIDSLSGIIQSTSQKQQGQITKEILYYIKRISKEHGILLIFTNSTREQNITRISELKNIINEPLSWGVEKQILTVQ